MKTPLLFLMFVITMTFASGFLHGTRAFGVSHFRPATIRVNTGSSIGKRHSQLSAGFNTLPSLDVPDSLVNRVISSLPNAMTMGRIFTIPVIVAAMASQKNSLALLLFIVSSVTDFLDGYLARRLNLQTSFGAFLDPVADKLLMASILTLLSVKYPSMWFAVPVAVILCREIAVSALREWMAERSVRSSVQVSSIGKWKTAFQMISTALLLLVDLEAMDSYIVIGKLLVLNYSFILLGGVVSLYISALLTVYSGFKYFQAAWPLLFHSR